MQKLPGLTIDYLQVCDRGNQPHQPIELLASLLKAEAWAFPGHLGDIAQAGINDGEVIGDLARGAFCLGGLNRLNVL
ncbi:hypothetical protein ASC91_22560 [Pelomonas sp. Root1237]|nr:hypothetical protein ASC91_22560 [Pelomonas sp. Root1237]